MIIKKICPHCKKEFDLGYNGTVDGCDDCLNVKRDSHEHAWFPEETEHVYRPVHSEDDSQDFVVTRKEAFKSENQKG
jgi:deoxycytidylate deaminase